MMKKVKQQIWKVQVQFFLTKMVYSRLVHWATNIMLPEQFLVFLAANYKNHLLFNIPFYTMTMQYLFASCTN